MRSTLQQIGRWIGGLGLAVAVYGLLSLLLVDDQKERPMTTPPRPHVDDEEERQHNGHGPADDQGNAAPKRPVTESTSGHRVFQTDPAAAADPHNNEAVQHETRDIQVRPLALFGLFLFGLVIVSLGTVWGLDRVFTETQARPILLPTPANSQERLPPAPRLQEDPERDLREYIQQQHEELNGYRWIDEGRGLVKIPLDEAIDLTLQRGLPARQGAPPGNQGQVQGNPQEVQESQRDQP